jgi:hypothetical protein
VVGIRTLWPLFPGKLARTSLALILPVTFAGAMVFTFQRLNQTTPDAPFTKHDLPGFAIELPAWTVEEAGKDFWFGSFKLADPSGGGRFVEVRWSAGAPDPQKVLEVMAELMKARVVSRTPLQVAGRPSEVVHLQEVEGTKSIAFSAFDCADERAAYLVTFLHLPTERLLAFHQRAASSITCVAGSRPERSHPRVDLPASLVRTETPSGTVYASAAEDGYYFFSAAVPGSKLPSDLASDERLRKEILAAEFNTRSIQLQAGVVEREASGGKRSLWFAMVEPPDSPRERVTLTAWHCPARNESFLAYHVDRRQAPDDKPITALLSAQCP